MKKSLFLFFIFLLSSLPTLILFSKASTARAENEEALILDTSDHYLGACGMTDATTWTQDKDLEVTTFQIWYYWASGEGPVSFVLQKDGEEFAKGKLTRTTCDPYQTSWCNGDLKINKTFPKGSYNLKVFSKKQCAIPSGNGTVRLYGQKEATVSEPITDPSIKLIFDSTDHYLGGCGMTDTTTWTSKEDMDIAVMQIWYSWQSNEKSVSFVFTKDAEEFAKGAFTKTRECQWTWCNGNYDINKLFPKNSNYELKIETARQCRDDKGRGTVRLYGEILGQKPTLETVSPTPPVPGKSSIQPWHLLGLSVFILIIMAIIIAFLKKK